MLFRYITRRNFRKRNSQMTLTLLPSLNNTVWLQTTLNYLESIISNEALTIDYQARAYYVFKPFPASLKPSQREEWASVQVKMLSPFNNGDSYLFVTPQGVAIWSSQTAFEGLPETAVQSQLADGEHYVKGREYFYRQVWNNNVMVECHIVAPVSGQAVDITEPVLSWAKTRKIDELIQAPLFWGGSVGIVFALFLLLQLGGYLSLSIQGYRIDSQIQSMEQKVGNSMELQQGLRSQQQLIDNLSSWTYGNGLLPQSFARALASINKIDTWDVGAIEWQDSVIVIELSAANLELSELVAELESVNEFERVSIRPHTKENTWLLELESKTSGNI